MITRAVSQPQREAIKAAIEKYGWGGQTLLARSAGIAKPTLNIWLATGRGLSGRRAAQVLRQAHKLFGMTNSNTAKQLDARPV